MTRSIQQLPNNVSSTQVIEVATATGFNAGDLVYYQNNDYKSSTNLTGPSSANFPITQNVPLSSSTGVSAVVQPIFGTTQIINATNGGTTKRFAAKLTNGNIVQVWFNRNGTYAACPYFQIVNAAGTIVVSPTLISSSYPNSYPNITVVALTGGGFSVIWLNGAGGTVNTVNYAIYTNTGSVTTAVTQDATLSFSTNYAPLEATALANGGFAVACISSGNVLYLRGYGSTGTGAYAWLNTSLTNYGALTSAGASFAMTSRSDSSVFICNMRTTTNYYYGIFSSTGTTIVASTTIAMGGTMSTSFTHPDASVLSDGTTIVIAYYGFTSSGFGPCFRFLPTGNTLGSQNVAVPYANEYISNGNQPGTFISVLGLSAGGFALVFTDPFGTIQYAFYNSSGVVLTPTNITGTIPQPLFSGYCDLYNRVTLVESGTGNLNLYWPNSNYYSIPTNQYYAQINETTYLPVVVNSASATVANITNIVGSSIVSNTRPSSVTYYSGSTTSTLVTNAIASVVSATTLTSVTCSGISSCVLTNSNYVIGYQNSTTGLVTINVYNTLNILVTTFTLTGNTVGDTLKISALSNGGFIVANATSSTTVNLSVYSSAYTLVSTITLTVDSINTSQTFDVAGLSNGNYAFVYYSGGAATGSVYSNSNTLIQSSLYVNPYGASVGLSISANSTGGFGITTWDNTSTVGTQLLTTYYQNASNSYTSFGTNSISTFTNYYQHNAITATPYGTYVYAGGTGSTYGLAQFYENINAPITQYTALSAVKPFPSVSYGGIALGTTSNGNIVMVAGGSATIAYVTFIPNNLTNTNVGSVSTAGGYPGSLSLTITGSFNYANTGSTGGPLFKISPMQNNNVLITWLGSDQYPRYAIYSCAPNISQYGLTSGSSISSPVAINPNPNTSGNITGIFVGVAATTASAGSTGQVIINGLAQLNSNYSATNVGSFDYTGQSVSGVKGTFNGRNVNMQGNS